jgi:hypothetical protein
MQYWMEQCLLEEKWTNNQLERMRKKAASTKVGVESRYFPYETE